MNRLEPGDLVAERFLLERLLGDGGEGRVHLATDIRDNSKVALKVLSQPVPDSRIFRRECAIAMQSRHPGLVRLVDAGVHGRQPWLALAFVDGPNARTWMLQQGGAPRAVLQMAGQVFLALDAMHLAGLAHGDIKPDNILIAADGAKLTDFGRARLGHLFEYPGVFPGTPGYMHPELYKGGSPNAATDCFALWVSVYELIVGVRPYSMGTLQWDDADGLGPPDSTGDSALDALLWGGLRAAYRTARSGWLAIELYLDGAPATPWSPPPRAAPDPRSIDRLNSDALDRSWRRAGLPSLWMRPTQAVSDRPLEAALSVVAHAPENLRNEELAAIATALGPLSGALVAAVPAARAWLPDAPVDPPPPSPERLAVALDRVVRAAPQPLLVLAPSIAQMDGASRRWMTRAVTTGEVTVVGSVAAAGTHGLPQEQRLRDPNEPSIPTIGDIGSEARSVLNAAKATGLPLGPLLRQALALDETAFHRLCIQAEAAGHARWTGELVRVAEHWPPPSAERGAHWCAMAAQRISPAQHPLLVARLARLGGDHARLAQVMDAALEAARLRDPTEALALALADPRPATPARLLGWTRVALVAQDIGAAEAWLAQLRAHPDTLPEDLAQAEGELHHRRGALLPAIDAFRRAAKALGRPIRQGFWGLVDDIVAATQIVLGRMPSARPDARLAVILEHLYDLQFAQDQRLLLRTHRMWLSAAPSSLRAASLEVIWRLAFGRLEHAGRLEKLLQADVGQRGDRSAEAVLVMHRGMARLLRGDTVDAFADGVDASEALLRAGDPYLAALAVTVPIMSGIHLGTVGPQLRLLDALRRQVAITGDERGAGWVAGGECSVLWAMGETEAALDEGARWAATAQERGDNQEALARRKRAEILLESRRTDEALAELARVETVRRRFGIRMDFVDAACISWLVADAQSRMSGASGIQKRKKQRTRMRGLAATSPRWTPRVHIAGAWQAAAAGDQAGAHRLFVEARREANERHQVLDAWLALHHQGLALDDPDALATAQTLAMTHGLKHGRQAVTI